MIVGHRKKRGINIQVIVFKLVIFECVFWCRTINVKLFGIEKYVFGYFPLPGYHESQFISADF
jgi:hypothetical protein